LNSQLVCRPAAADSETKNRRKARQKKNIGREIARRHDEDANYAKAQFWQHRVAILIAVTVCSENNVYF
jgi:hypothetical protein